MAEAFQMVSVDKSLTNWGHRHITAVGTAPKPGFLEVWPISSVLSMLAAGDLFYIFTDLGDPVFAHGYRCWCGFETIRATANDETNDGLENLPTSHGEQTESTPAAS